MKSTHLYWLLSTLIVGVTIWATIPQQVFVLDRACKPGTLRAKFSRAVYGDGFWRAQLAGAVAERDRLLIRLNHPDEQVADDEPAYESRMMRLSDEDRNASADVKAQHQEDTRKRRVDRMIWLSLCQQGIDQRLAR
jgi:hypothetical protein